jgi:hypothetical protein
MGFSFNGDEWGATLARTIPVIFQWGFGLLAFPCEHNQMENGDQMKKY